MDWLLSFIVLGLFAFISVFFYERRNPFFQLVPFGLIAGAAVLLITRYHAGAASTVGDYWAAVPGLLINVVFATLFLGKKLISPRKIWSFAGAQVVFGQTLAWGQYVVGILLTMLVLVPVFNVSPMAGALIEISFEGGHGTAAGLSDLFKEIGFEEGTDLALGLATVGIVTGLLSGILLNTIYQYKKRRLKEAGSGRETPAHKKLSTKNSLGQAFARFVFNTGSRFLSKHKIFRTLVQLGLIGLAIFIGYLIKLGLLGLEAVMLKTFTDIEFVRFIPLFPLAMIGGIIVQILVVKFKIVRIVHGGTVAFIGDLALEVVIITAIATMSLATISDNIVPFVLLATVGIIWNLIAFLFFAPRFIRKHWFERGIGDFGQSMGMTATGLLLMRTADTKNETHAIERFGYKQLLFEPIVGGGIFTALSALLIFRIGLMSVLIITSVVFVFWVILGFIVFARKTDIDDTEA